MLTAYIFCLVLGGSLLLLSILGDFLGDAGGDLDLGGSPDFPVEIDAGSVDLGDADVDLYGHGAEPSHASRILSIRTLTYALFGFGAVGTLLTFFGSANVVTIFGTSLVGGLLSGALVTSAFRYLETTDTGAQASDVSFVGLSGTVTLPISPSSAGRISVQRGERRIALRALPHESADGGDPTDWTSVVVVDMENGVARVSPVAEDLSLEP